MKRCIKEFEDQIYNAMIKENINCRIGAYYTNENSIYIEVSEVRNFGIRSIDATFECVHIIGNFTTKSRDIDSIVKGIKRLILLDNMRR